MNVGNEVNIQGVWRALHRAVQLTYERHTMHLLIGKPKNDSVLSSLHRFFSVKMLGRGGRLSGISGENAMVMSSL